MSFILTDWLLLSAEPLSNSGDDFGSWLIRVVAGMLILAVFTAACGIAWRIVPALKEIIPPQNYLPQEEPGLAYVSAEDSDDPKPYPLTEQPLDLPRSIKPPTTISLN